ncbi:MAG: hypothetical protein KAY24_01095 [Candidatus Eisenbacteria sp.]|nr:hypothetical protein [Candidatus Eisenbacteria bacterium]
MRTWALEGCSGDFCSQSRTIRLARGLSPGAAVDVLIHELGHAAEDDLELATSAARIAGSAWDPYARRVYRYSPACGAEYAGEALGTEVVSTGVELIAGAASRGNLRLLLAGCRGAQATYVARAIF